VFKLLYEKASKPFGQLIKQWSKVHNIYTLNPYTFSSSSLQQSINHGILSSLTSFFFSIGNYVLHYLTL